jgi:hypothetical protein
MSQVAAIFRISKISLFELYFAQSVVIQDHHLDIELVNNCGG